MQMTQCEMCKHCKVKLNNDMSLTVSCNKGKHDKQLRETFNGHCKCEYIEYMDMALIYPLIFKNIKFD